MRKNNYTRSLDGWAAPRRVSALFVAFAIPLLGGFISPRALIAQESVTNSAAEFRRFLSNPPYVKSMLFGESIERFSASINGKAAPHVPGYVMFELGRQSNSFFVRSVSNFPSIYSPGQPGGGKVVGKSTSAYWRITPDQSQIGFQAESEGDASKLSLRREIDSDVGVLDAGFSLGIAQLRLGSFRWTGESSFQGDSRFGEIKGEITEATNGLPLKLRYRFHDLTNLVRETSYIYDEEYHFPPQAMLHWFVEHDKPVCMGTDVIARLETGEASDLAGGYVPSLFLSNPQSIPLLVMVSNSLTYLVRPDGSLEPLRTATAAESMVLEPKVRTRSALRLAGEALAGGLVFGLVCLIWLRLRQARH